MLSGSCRGIIRSLGTAWLTPGTGSPRPILRRNITTSVTLQKAQLIDGKKVASDIYEELSKEVQTLVASGKRAPHLVLVRIGGDPASGSYVKNKMKAAEKIGMQSTIHHLPEDTSQSSLLSLVNELNVDPDVDGILVQLPVPPHMEEKIVCNSVVPEKDVDGFHITNIGIETYGKNAVVCGRSKNVGMPMAMLLHGDGVRPDGATGGLDATTTICHRYTPAEQLRVFTETADIIVTAAGVPGLITGDMIKPGCAILDIGINRIKDPVTGKAKLVGDCDFASCSEKAAYITPVPGGVGPMTVAMLMRNTVIAAKKAT